MAFKPLFPAHSIERCALTLNFDQELPSKPFQRIIEIHSPKFNSLGFVPGQSMGIKLDLKTGGVSTPTLPVNFLMPDKSMNILIAPRTIQIQTAKYVRWAPFMGMVSELVLPIVQEFCQSLSIRSAQLEYVDTYVWDGSWSNFSWKGLLKSDGEFVTGRAPKARQQWHAHSGWFEDINDNFRRLLAANINIVERSNAGPSGASIVGPAIQILTLCRDEIFAPLGKQAAGALEFDTLTSRFDDLHSRLKNLLKDILIADVATQIGLT